MKLSYCTKRYRSYYKSANKKRNIRIIPVCDERSPTILAIDELTGFFVPSDVSMSEHGSRYVRKAGPVGYISELAEFATKKGYVLIPFVKEVGYGLNSNGGKVQRFVRDRRVINV
jgi:hypothetical protein